jgi:hypothetical protein
MADHRPDRRRVVAVVGLHVVPVVERRRTSKENDVALERFPSPGREAIATVGRVIERRLRWHDQVDAEVHHLAREDLVLLSRIGLRDGDAFVDSLVAELSSVFGTEVVMKKLVAVVKARRAEVPEAKVGADRHDGERERDPLRPAPSRRRVARGERGLVHG